MELNGNGRLLSLEGSPSLVARSNRTVEDLGLGGRVSIVEGPFNQTLESALRSIEPVQYAFIDGHHLEVATVDYMETILEFVDRDAVLVFDDINWSDGMRRAWARVRQDSRFSMFVDFGNVGIGIVSAADNGRRTIEVPYG